MNDKGSKVEAYIESQSVWRTEIQALRNILLSCDVEEDFKWKHPCYTDKGKNLVIIQDFKEYCALLFPKGVLMRDPDNLLVPLSENAQADKQIRFSNMVEIESRKDAIAACVAEAVRVERSGEKVSYKKTEDFEVAPEFQEVLDRDESLREAFFSLTPGRQRAYLLHFSGAKQSATRTSRVENCIPRILDGLGLNDR
ncbi:MAG: YdeI/OmpD-associated family protein [Spirochaetales bacterium]|nr:YdeI/OmpD-associated family protein [Spirochaetales bacterium]